MIGDVIGTFRNTTTAVDQEFVRKNQIETNTSKIWYVSHVSSGDAILLPDV